MCYEMSAAKRASKTAALRWLGRLGVLLLAGAMASACSTFSPAPAQPSPGDTATARCLEFLRMADQLAAEQAVSDAMYARVAGYPFLRVSRFLASYSREVGLPAQRRFWLEQLRGLDQEARTFEIGNLDAPARARLQSHSTGPISTHLRACGQQLVAALADDPRAMTELPDLVMVPDDYSMLMRTLGVYPLTRWPFLYGIRGWQADTRRTFERPLSDPPADSRRVAYRPAPTIDNSGPQATLPVASTLPTMTSARANPLSIPLPDKSHLSALLYRHAPIIAVDERSRADQPGMPVWRRARVGQADPTPDVDESRPVMTVRVGHTRVNGLALLQLNYTAWFSARPLTGPLDLLGGAIDGLTWRVTLDPQGAAWAYDSIHPCGCYHLFFPGPRARPRAEALAPGIEEGLFLVESLADVSEGQRVQIRLAPSTHYIQSVQVVDDRVPIAGSKALALIDEDVLRSLPLGEDRRRSWYGPDGLVAGTGRGERFLFWPMGIQSAGAMRQAGRQATAFVGRRHFDDADLFDRYFELVRPISPAQ